VSSLLRPGSRVCQCAACGRYFGGVAAFDLHRVGPAERRVCADPASILSTVGLRRRLWQDERMRWVRDYQGDT
jgi:hypothetical protein